jgi:hypothetical protein
MPKPVVARALPDYRIWVRYDDGAEGAVDLSDLAGHGVFRAWADPAVFASVRIGPTGAIEWAGDIDLCPDAVYLRLTGKRPEDLFPSLRLTRADA